MYLKRLELRGFKTFSSYTDFLFDAGITTIVGPNGSGKSNIADAARWVLGEQSYSVLRGKRTEDMIFAGTTKKPRVGMAEAVMTFDNSSQWLPVDFSEVTISRRAYRSGENQYFLNGSRVRLRDMLELLGKAGLGRRGFVVIGQGLVDAALSLRPEQRRVLFEEAAGVHIYQDKRRDALNKLAETQQNILRVNDILNEISPRARALERQAKRAEERQLLQSDLEQLLRIWYGYHWRRLQDKLAEAVGLLDKRLKDANLARARLHEVEELIAGTQARQSELRQQLSTWHKASGDLHGAAEIVGRELAVSRERLKLQQQRRGELTVELTQLHNRQTALRQDIATVEQELQRLQDELHERSDAMQEIRSRLLQAETARAQLEGSIAAERDEAFQEATALADLRNRLQQIGERVSEVQTERAEQLRELARIEDQQMALEKEISLEADRQRDAQDSLTAAQAHGDQLGNQATAQEKVVAQHRHELDEAARKLQRLTDRQKMLQALRQNLEGFGPGVKAVLGAQDKLSGIVGPVARLLGVPKRLESAVEAALGAHAQALVVKRWEDARRAIQMLRDSKAGRATFLPLDSLEPPPAGEVLSGEGVLGLAQELVEFDERDRPIVQLLLGSTLIVDNLETARRVRPDLRGAHRIVTQSGEIVTASGTITGGSKGSVGGLLALEREWRQLPEHLGALQREEDSLAQTLKKAEDQLQTYRREITTTTKEITRRSTECRVIERKQGVLDQKREQLRQETEWRHRLDAQQQRELSGLKDKGVTLRREMDHHSQKHNDLTARLTELLAELQTTSQEDDTARQAALEGETALAVVQRQEQMQHRLLSNHTANLSLVEQEIKDRSERATELGDEAVQLETSVHELQEKASSLSTQVGDLTALLDPAEREVIALENQVLEMERGSAHTRQRLMELETLHNQQVLERERQGDALQSLERKIEEDLGSIAYPLQRVQQLRMEIGQKDQALAPTTVLPQNLDSEIAQLKRRLGRLSNVNPNAPQEYRELRERRDFMQTQINDLQQSASSLHQVIRELDEIMKEEFLSVFSVAAAEFPRYFETLFGGGKARLRLTDPEHLSVTGVEILARPPGRRQQSLALLSGGERALTATALLFSVLKAKPLPFCLLDEVDAMLDEANVGRFRELLREFSAQTQFIVITHNRQTVEAANTIYGVSMTKEGVSQVLSLQLEDVK